MGGAEPTERGREEEEGEEGQMERERGGVIYAMNFMGRNFGG